MTDTVGRWIERGGDSIRLWLEGGVAHAGDLARQTMTAWIRGCADAGWADMADLGQTLLDDETSEKEKADALLNLCVRFEAVRCEFDRYRLLERYEADRGAASKLYTRP